MFRVRFSIIVKFGVSLRVNFSLGLGLDIGLGLGSCSDLLFRVGVRVRLTV